jgi:hypothetical protein
LVPGIGFHEFGHVLEIILTGHILFFFDPTGETTGDWTAALALHDSCVGTGYLQADCSGFGDACTACTGLRDLDFAKHLSGMPATVANFTAPFCPAALSPPFPVSVPGPCGFDSYCESTISSQALWDLVNRDLGDPGTASAWTLVDRLWFLSRPTATAPFSCHTGGAVFTSDGCGIGSLWEIFRAIDDDDGNLADGTPHAGALFAAFARHGIACASDPGASTTFAACTPPVVPALATVPGDDQATLTWTASGPAVYDVFRNEAGCDTNFARIATAVAGTSLTDSEVANGMTYYYRVAAHAAGNEACASALSACQPVTPAAGGACSPPAAPSGLRAVASAGGGFQLVWKEVPGATSYRVLRGTASGGLYLEVGETRRTALTDGSGSCGTSYAYVVRAVAGCESGSSGIVTATTPACPVCTRQTLYSDDFEHSTGNAGWLLDQNNVDTQWYGVQACSAHSGTHIFRFGGVGCGDDYRPVFPPPSATYDSAQPTINLPPGATGAQLSFWHRRDFPSNTGGGTLALAQNFGVSAFVVPASTIVAGESYNGSFQSTCAPAVGPGPPIFTGTQDTFVNTVVDLDAACRLAGLAGQGQCTNSLIPLAFVADTDCGPTGRGWFLDDVQVTACVPPPPLPPAPPGLGFFTMRPCRLVDTRTISQGPALRPGEQRLVQLDPSPCGIPSFLFATSFTANVTVVAPQAPGFLDIHAYGSSSSPATEVINFRAGATLANAAILGVGNQFVDLPAFWIENRSAGQVNVLLDVSGYFGVVR